MTFRKKKKKKKNMHLTPHRSLSSLSDLKNRARRPSTALLRSASPSRGASTSTCESSLFPCFLFFSFRFFLLDVFFSFRLTSFSLLFLSPLFLFPPNPKTKTKQKKPNSWYANTYGSWGWKSPPLSLVMYDNWGNRLQVEVFVTLNLKTWEVWNTKVTNIQFLGGGGWGSGKK